MDKKTHLVSALCLLVVTLLVCSCGGNITDDEVAIVKQLLATFERGVDQKSQSVLDSVIRDRKSNLSLELLESLLTDGEYEAARIASKSFAIIGDSAEVRLTLSLDYGTDQEEPRQIERPIRLYLNKKRGKWRIESFGTATDEVVRDEQERP
ncbi:MAG: hypothetical protein JSV10_03895 [Candidatus Zixiibacteriota bacterium]|nr:MAG: hypothetical protein JSV10_03895 [candidate division Zixibacteria bacterium]